MKKCLGAFWLGASLAYFTGKSFLTWEFWVIVIPTLILFLADENIKNR